MDDGADEPPASPSGSEPDSELARLSETEVAILRMEQTWWKYQAAKETVIREQFDMSPTRYYMVLNALIDKPTALAADPVTVNRLRRLRTARQQARTRRDADTA